MTSATPPNKTPSPWPAIAVTAFGALAGTTFPLMVTLSVADIGGGLSATADDVAWLGTVYDIGQLISLPLIIYFSQTFGRGKAMQLGGLGYAISSLAMALAPSLGWAIAARLLHGLFGGTLAVLMFMILFSVFPPGPGRTRGLAAFAAATSLGAGIAASLGGQLLVIGGWQALFYAQVLVGAAYFFLARRLFRCDPINLAVLRQTDWVGYCLLTVAVSCFVLVLSEGERRFWFETWWITTALLFGVTASIAAIRHLWVGKAPMLQLGLFRKPFTLAITFQVIFRFGTLLAVFIAPQYLGRIAGLRIEQMGSMLLPMSLGTAVAIPVALWLSSRVDQRVMLSTALALFAGAALYCLGLGPDWNAGDFAVAAFAAGVGQGIFAVSTLFYAIYDLERHEGVTCGIVFNYCRVLGQVGGVAAFSHLINEREKLYSARLGEPISHLHPDLALALQQGAASVTRWLSDPAQVQARVTADLARRIARQAFTLAYADAFLGVAALLTAGAILAWALPSYFAPKPETASSHLT
jgi:DHA2 family multidrug resistance protein